MATIGGGRILDANPQRHRRFDEAVARRLESVAAGDVVATLEQLISQSGLVGIDAHSASERLSLPVDSLQSAVGKVGAVAIGDRLVARAALARLTEEIAGAVSRHHGEHPRERGIAAGRIKTSMSPEPHEAVFRRAVADLVASGKLRSEGDVLALSDFDPLAVLNERERAVASQLEKTFLDFGLAPPPLSAVVDREKQKGAAYRVLLETGRLVKLRTYDRTTELVVHAATLEDVKQKLRKRYAHPATFAMKDVRELLDTSRRVVAPIMEHLDSTGVTIRVGDSRRLRES
jgi:selenocysteine-specific elongation factor